MEYPKKLFNLHKDLPFLPERKTVFDLHKNLSSLLERKKLEEVKKLVCNIEDKEKYVIHIRALKTSIKSRIRIKKSTQSNST